MNMITIFNVQYNDWALPAINKIIKCIDTSTSEDHFKTCRKMISQFTLITITNSNLKDSEIVPIVNHLNTYLNTKRKAQI
jgi:hypothetical protein